MKFGVKTKLVSLMLGFVMLFSCVLATAVQVKAYAAVQFDVDEINAQLDAAGIDEDSIDLEDSYIEETYESCLFFDYEENGPRLAFDLGNTEIYETYGESVLDWSVDYEAFVEEFWEPLLDEDCEEEFKEMLREECDADWAEICKLREVQRNIEVMNECVDEELAYYDESSESPYDLVFYEDITSTARLRAWNIKFKWNKVSACFDDELSIIYVTFWLCYTFISDAKSLEQIIETFEADPYSSRELILTLWNYIPYTLSSQLQDLLESEIFEFIASIMRQVAEIKSSTSIFELILKMLKSLFAPSLGDCAIVLYKSFFHSTGAKVTTCWFGTRKQRGTFVQVL